MDARLSRGGSAPRWRVHKALWGILLGGSMLAAAPTATATALGVSLASAALPQHGEEGSMEPPGHCQPEGLLLVMAQVVGRGGPPPPPGITSRPRLLGPAADARIQVVRADAPEAVVAEQVTDAGGGARLGLPAGRYWVLMPWGDGVPGRSGATAVGANLPDGRPVLAWQEATVPPGGTAEATLTIVLALP